jgi:hypothetical protein
MRRASAAWAVCACCALNGVISRGRQTLRGVKCCVVPHPAAAQGGKARAKWENIAQSAVALEVRATHRINAFIVRAICLSMDVCLQMHSTSRKVPWRLR